MLRSGEPVAGVVVEFTGGPGTWVTKTYSAAQGKGATMNGRPIAVSAQADVSQSLLASPNPDHSATNRYHMLSTS